MGIVTTLSSLEFDENTGEARGAAEKGPVFITQGGQASHVLLSIEAYRRLVGRGKTISDRLYMEGVAELDLPIPSLRDDAVGADLTD